MAFAYFGPIGDGGWTYAHDQARLRLQAEYGGKIATTYMEGVGDDAAAEKAFRDMAAAGHHVIFGTSRAHLEPMSRVAHDYPGIKFHQVAGISTKANLAIYEARAYEGAYLAGILAGKVTRTGTLGFVGSVATEEVFRNINAFTLGAQSVNPGVTTQVLWVDRWFDPKKEREIALALIRQGADVLIQNTDSPAVLETAQEKGVHAFGWTSDTKHHGVTAHLGSAVIDWTPYYKAVVDSVLQGRWKPEAVWLGARNNVIRIASPNPALPSDLILLLGEKTHELKTGRLHPFRGPVTNRDGATEIENGALPGDTALRRMNYFVKGVRGDKKDGSPSHR